MLRDEAHGWLKLGEVAPQLLIETRMQTVWAGSLLTAVAAAHVARPQADANVAMEWLRAHELLAAEPATDGRAFRVGLRISNLSLVLLDAIERPLEEFALDRRTLEDARVWLEDAIADYRDDRPVPLRLSHKGLPSHPVGGGRVFEIGAADACLELARWYTGADVVLRELASVTPEASSVRCWPERLDLRTAIALRSENGHFIRVTALVGMSPGDSYFAEPYWYVALHPVSATCAFPSLAHGAEWHTRDWVGAVLRARKLLPGSASGQRERLVAFLGEAMSLGRELLVDVA